MADPSGAPLLIPKPLQEVWQEMLQLQYGKSLCLTNCTLVTDNAAPALEPAPKRDKKHVKAGHMESETITKSLQGMIDFTTVQYVFFMQAACRLCGGLAS